MGAANVTLWVIIADGRDALGSRRDDDTMTCTLQTSGS
jgi:hypothetical protein